MSFSIDEFNVYLPYYLSEQRKKGILKELKNFPSNMQYFTTKYEEDVLQGDGFSDLVISNHKGETKKIKGILLSNSCDMDINNKRTFLPKVVFSPLVNLEKYIMLLKKRGVLEQDIEQQISQIRLQKITNMFYLPKKSTNENEYIILLDDLYNIPINVLPETNKKIFTLSQSGFYMFLFKISIHFCRFHENIERDI